MEKPEPGPKGSKERTLTAVRSPFADGATPSVPVLFVIGNARLARTEPAGTRRWWILPAWPTDRLDGPGEIAWIGRAPGDDDSTGSVAVLLSDPLISGRHARLLRGEAGFFIEDLASKNGTMLDGERITGRVPLPEGGVVSVGEHAVVLRLVSPHALLAMEEEAAAPLGPVATACPELALTAQKLRRWAVGGQEILLLGETGVGKEVYARAVHAASGRSGPFVALNCAALPRELVESELFGYRAGAHSTAQKDKPGLIERAQGGTLFLDEIGELPQEGQAKLLRFLQDRELVPLGGRQGRRIEVAIVAATNQMVVLGNGGGEALAKQALRPDLVGRLGAAPVQLPPLRERREDLGALCQYFLAALLPKHPSPPGLEAPAFRALCLHGFPLNVRELEKVLGAAVSLTQGARPIALADLPPVFRPTSSQTRPPARPAPAAPRASEERGGTRQKPSPGPSAAELEALLAAHQGNVAEVSRVLGRQRAAVWRWIKRFGLGVQRHRPPGAPPEDGDDGPAK